MWLNFTKMGWVLGICLLIQVTGEAQSLEAKLASTSKVVNLNIGEAIAQKDQLLLDLVTKAGLMPVLTNGEDHTFFAPSAQALAQHQNDSPEQLRAFLGQHMVKGSLTTDDLRDGADIRNLNGNTLRICRKKGALLISGVRLTESNQLYLNGVWHHLSGAIPTSTNTF